MAGFLHRNRVAITEIGTFVSVPNNDVARLMYYLQCVCVAVDCNDDPSIQRFTNYNNWASLSVDEQKALVVACYAFSPDILNNRVFFNSDATPGNSLNEFYEISELNDTILASRSIIIAERERQVNKIMTYTTQWMANYYFEPMKRLVTRFDSQSRTFAITYSSSSQNVNYSPPVVRQPTKKSSSCHYGFVCGIIYCIITIVIIVSTAISVTRNNH